MMAEETLLFLVMVICGAASAVFYDIIRAARAVIKANVIVTAVLDVIFTLTFFCSAMACVWKFGSGKFRAYELLGLCIGASLYFLLLSGAAYKFFVYVGKKISKIIVFIFKLLLTPLAFLYKILIVPIQKRLTDALRRRKRINVQRTKEQSG